jgi:hypothetical protein
MVEAEAKLLTEILFPVKDAQFLIQFALMEISWPLDGKNHFSVHVDELSDVRIKLGVSLVQNEALHNTQQRPRKRR